MRKRAKNLKVKKPKLRPVNDKGLVLWVLGDWQAANRASDKHVRFTLRSVYFGGMMVARLERGELRYGFRLGQMREDTEAFLKLVKAELRRKFKQDETLGWSRSPRKYKRKKRTG